MKWAKLGRKSVSRYKNLSLTSLSVSNDTVRGKPALNRTSDILLNQQVCCRLGHSNGTYIISHHIQTHALCIFLNLQRPGVHKICWPKLCLSHLNLTCLKQQPASSAIDTVHPRHNALRKKLMLSKKHYVHTLHKLRPKIKLVIACWYQKWNIKTRQT